jgi:uncharacterized protein (DUF4415 family)
MKKKPLIDENGEVREITADDLKSFKPASEVLPLELLAVLPKKGIPVKETPKKQTTVRIDADIMDWLKSQGKGYQTRINAILRSAMENQKHI